MSWNTDDGLHEGYLLPGFADGHRGDGTTGGGVPPDQMIVDVEYVGEPGAITDTRYTTRQAAEVVGWRIICDCRSPHSPAPCYLGTTGGVVTCWSESSPGRSRTSARAGSSPPMTTFPDVGYRDEFLCRLAWRRFTAAGSEPCLALARTGHVVRFHPARSCLHWK